MNNKVLKSSSRILGAICICFMVLAFAKAHTAHAAVDTAKVAKYAQAVNKMVDKFDPSAQGILEAKDLYFKMFTATDSPETRDEAFFVFFNYYEGVQQSYKWMPYYENFSERNKGDLAKAKTYFAKYGLTATYVEGSYYPTTDYKYLFDTFGNIVSPLTKDCLDYLSPETALYAREFPDLSWTFFESDNPSSSEIVKVAEIFRQKVLQGDHVLRRKPTGGFGSAVGRKLAYMFTSYFRYFDRQGIYGADGVLRPELKKSYEQFLKENTDFTYYASVKALYDLFEQNNFTSSTNGLEWKVHNLIDSTTEPMWKHR